MNKFAAIVSAFVYLVLSTGVHVHIDTCCNTVENMLMTALPMDCCADEDQEAMACAQKSCGDHQGCPTLEIDMQLDGEFLASAQTAVVIDLPVEAMATPCIAASMDHQGDGNGVCSSGPPLAQPIYILHSSLVYYG